MDLSWTRVFWAAPRDPPMEWSWTRVWVCWAAYILGGVASIYITAWIWNITVDPYRLWGVLSLVSNGFTVGLVAACVAYKEPSYMQL